MIDGPRNRGSHPFGLPLAKSGLYLSCACRARVSHGRTRLDKGHGGPLKQIMKTTQEQYACPAGPRETARRPSLQGNIYSEPNSGWRFFVVGNVSLLYETLLCVIASREFPGHVLLETLASGRLRVISAFAPEIHRITRATALERNRLVASLATELFVPHIRDKSPLLEIVQNASSTPLE